MEPTALAMKLAPKVRAWLEESIDFFHTQDQFDLTNIKTTVKIGTLGGIESTLLPPLLAALQQSAPGIQIWCKILERDEILAALDDEVVDIAIGPSGLQFKEWHHSELISSAPFVCVYSPDQLSLPKVITVKELATLEHVSLSWRGDTSSEADSYFERCGLERKVFLRTTDQWAAIRLLREYPIVSLQAEPITSSYPNVPGIAICQIAAEDFVVYASTIWHQRNDRQSAHTHVRKIIKDIAIKASKR